MTREWWMNDAYWKLIQRNLPKWRQEAEAMSSKTIHVTSHKHDDWASYGACEQSNGEPCYPPEGVPPVNWREATSATEASAPSANEMAGRTKFTQLPRLDDPLGQRISRKCKHGEWLSNICMTCVAPGGIVSPIKEYDALMAALRPHMLAGEGTAACVQRLVASAPSAPAIAQRADVLIALLPHMLSGEDAVSCVKRLVACANEADYYKGMFEAADSLIRGNEECVRNMVQRLEDPATLPPARAARPAIRGLSAASPHFRRSNAEEFSDFD